MRQPSRLILRRSSVGELENTRAQSRRTTSPLAYDKSLDYAQFQRPPASTYLRASITALCHNAPARARASYGAHTRGAPGALALCVWLAPCCRRCDRVHPLPPCPPPGDRFRRRWLYCAATSTNDSSYGHAPQLARHTSRGKRQAQQKRRENPVHERALAAVQERSREVIEGALAILLYTAVAFQAGLVVVGAPRTDVVTLTPRTLEGPILLA
jgi:hypothetical protein